MEDIDIRVARIIINRYGIIDCSEQMIYDDWKDTIEWQWNRVGLSWNNLKHEFLNNTVIGKAIKRILN